MTMKNPLKWLLAPSPSQITKKYHKENLRSDNSTPLQKTSNLDFI